jgi:hypothetical protein
MVVEVELPPAVASAPEEPEPEVEDEDKPEEEEEEGDDETKSRFRIVINKLCSNGSFLECLPPTAEARVRFPAGTCQAWDL